MIKTLIKLKDSFLKNLPWKIAAFFMAFAMWFLIMNVEDPLRNDIVPVRLELRNEDALAMGAAEGIHLENIDNLRMQEIRFQVHGTSRSIDAIRDNLRAYIDLSALEIAAAAQRGESPLVTVQIEGYTGTGANIISRNPSSVRLIMDTITTVEFSVGVIKEGEIDEDTFFLPQESISITPSTVSVTGPSSIVNRIERMAVAYSIDGATSVIHRENLPILALDAANMPVESPHLQFVNRADIELPIFRRGRLQVLQPMYNAQPPEGFGIHSISWSPQFLDVAGEEYAIAALAPIMLDPIPEGMIMHSTTAFYVPYDIRVYLPQGVFLIDPIRHTVTAEVFVEPFVQQDFVVPVENIVVLGMPPYAEIITEEITVRLSALQSIMAGVSTFTITAFAGNADLEEGYNEIPLVLALPARVRHVGEEALTITIYVEAAEEENEEEIEDDEEEAGD